MKIISCNSNIPLAQAIATRLSISLTPATVQKFHDGEIFVEIHDDVRGEDVFVIQSTSFPVNDNIMELLITLDALKRAAAKRIIAVIPYFGYARQDRMPSPRTPITAKLMADIITSAGADRVLTLDLHAGQIQGFFDIPVDNLYAAPVFVENIKSNYAKEVLIVSPDVGGVVRARVIAKLLGADLAIVDKRREQANKSEVVNIIGDVKGRDCILIDDMVDTAGTLCNAASSLIEQGANSVSAYVSHGILSGEAITKIANSKLHKLVITDSINIKLKRESLPSKIEILSVATLLAEAVKTVAEERLISCLNTEHL